MYVIKFIFRYLGLLLPTLFVWWFPFTLLFGIGITWMLPQYESPDFSLSDSIFFYSGLIINFFVTKWFTKEISVVKKNLLGITP